MGILERKGTLLAIPGIVIVLLEGLTRGWCENTPRENRKNPKDRTMWHCLGGIAEARGGSLRFC